MKTKNLLLLSAIVLTTATSNAQFGNLLNKIKGKPKTETATTDAKPAEESKVKMGKGSSKKSGIFATVWETQFENKATRLHFAMVWAIM